MGITKRPSSRCSDTLIPIDIDAENSMYFVSASENESDNESYTNTLPITINNSREYYRSMLNEISLSYEFINRNRNVETKTVSLKKKNVPQMGRRKANRALNESFLLSLKIDEQHSDDKIFFNNNKNGFSKAINMLYTWPNLKEYFIEGNDDLIQKINKSSVMEINNNKKSKRSIHPDVAFENLTPSQKSLYKQNSLPITVIRQLETDVVQYFSLVPNGVFNSVPLSNYHRMLLHSIARYYSLNATSENVKGRRIRKMVQIRNSYYNDFQPPYISLLDFIRDTIE